MNNLIKNRNMIEKDYNNEKIWKKMKISPKMKNEKLKHKKKQKNT